MFRSIAYTCGFMAVCLAAASVAYAQESTNRVDAKTDWSIFVEDTPVKECWLVSKPTSEKVTKNGKTVAANRSDRLLFVTYRPSQGLKGEISYTGGYPFKRDSIVTLTIGNKVHNMFIDGEVAWPATPIEDAKIRNELKAGSSAILLGESRTGKILRDTFSLNGFTAALAEAEKRCT